MSNPLSIPNSWNSKNLLKELFKTESPEQVVQTIPTQLIYLTIKQNGLKDSLELLEICSDQQRQILLDLDLWKKDNFDEESLWSWLELPDLSQDTNILKLIIRNCDLKLVSYLIIRYVNVSSADEPTDEPPGPHYYTPDKGYTWIHVHLAEPHRNFLLNRFLAAIFEYSAEIFYQLINVPNIATASQLEEDSFQDKQKRLSSEGFPDYERAWEINTPLDFPKNINTKEQQSKKLADNIKQMPVNFISEDKLIPFSDLWLNLNDTSELDAEMTLILNAAFIRWEIDLAELEQIAFASKQVKGAINIALEALEEEFSFDCNIIYQALGLQKIYRIGLGLLLDLQKIAKKLDPNTLQKINETNSYLFSIIAGLREDFPKMAIKVPKEPDLYEYLPFQTIEQLREIKDNFSEYL